MRPNNTDHYWNEQGEQFAGFYGRSRSFSPKNWVSRFLNARTEILLSLLDINRDSTVLDIGCGNGVHMKMIAPRCKQIAGVDISQGMLATAKRELEPSRLLNWSLHRADAERLPFPDLSFDWVISMGLLDYVDSPLVVLNECRRLLKESGYFVFTIPRSPSLFWFLRTPFGNTIKKKVFDLPPIRNALSKPDVESLLQSAGFNVLHVSHIWTAMWMIKARKKP